MTHCYDIMTNPAASQTDTRLMINKDLTVGNDSKGNLEVRGYESNSSLLGSVDSKQMVKKLCTSQKNINWLYFLTFTVNQRCHFGLQQIWEYINNKGW